MKRVLPRVRMKEAVERLLLGEAVVGHKGKRRCTAAVLTRGGGR